MARARNRACSHRHAVIVGCQRCGTTQLAQLLDAHPEIELAKPLRPEPKYFLDAQNAEWSREAYCRQVFGASTAAVCVEKSTSYFESPDYAERICAVLPEARIVILLRHPVDRTLSHYAFSVENGLETRPPEEALLADELPPLPPGVSVSPFRYVGRSVYVEPLRWYTQRFAHVKMLIMESTLGSARAMADLYAWLGVSPEFRPPGLGERSNRTKTPATVSRGLREELEARLLPQLETLESEFGLDVAVWRGSSAGLDSTG